MWAHGHLCGLAYRVSETRGAGLAHVGFQCVGPSGCRDELGDCKDHGVSEGPLGGPQVFCIVNTWVEELGQQQVGAMLDVFAQVPELAPVAAGVRS